MEETQTENDYYDPESLLSQDKKNFLSALKASHGIVTAAAQMVNISRRTHERWRKKDEVYNKAVEDIREEMIDIAETALHKKIKDGDMIAILFFLKTIGRQRGYIEKKIYEIEGLEKIQQSQRVLAAAAGFELTDDDNETKEDDAEPGESDS